jgi:hypothetical protein
MPEPCNVRFDIRLIVLGFLVALFSASIGIGGGTLLVSILMSVFNFDFKKASSTSLATIIPISLIGSVSHFIFHPDVSHIRYYVTFIPVCVLGTILGIKIIRKHQKGWFKIAFSLFLIITGLRILKIVDFPSLIYNGLHGILLLNEWFLLVLTGIMIGIIAVTLGIGCGLVIVPFYVIVIHFNIHEAIALSLTTMFFITLSATIIHNRFRTLDIVPLKSLFIPALAGAVVGALISDNLPSPILKRIFGMFLLIIACNYLIHETAMYFNLVLPVKNYRKWVRNRL